MSTEVVMPQMGVLLLVGHVVLRGGGPGLQCESPRKKNVKKTARGSEENDRSTYRKFKFCMVIRMHA